MVTISHEGCHIIDECLPNSAVRLALTKRNELIHLLDLLPLTRCIH
jgi:hypothetical protein